MQDQIRHYVETDINKRRDYLKTVAMTCKFNLFLDRKLINRIFFNFIAPDSSTESQSLHILPDYMLAFGIAVLVHDPSYTNHEDYVQLRKMEKCLRFIIEPLMAKRESFVYGFYKQLLQLIKHREYAQSSDKDRTQNNYVCCSSFVVFTVSVNTNVF